VRVHLAPSSKLSRAMHRTADALRRYAPKGVEIVDRSRGADLRVLHVIGIEDLQSHCDAGPYAVMQYCWKTARGSSREWNRIWVGASLVWSYYDLPVPPGTPFLRAPLGVDSHAFQWGPDETRQDLVVTSGYVAGPGAESIEEVAEAALRSGMEVVHIGPQNVEGMARRTESTWSARMGLSDQELAGILRRARWVSGLRRVEGFELPALEAIACGARPIVFNRPDMRHWYAGHAIMVDECGGDPLVEALTRIFQTLRCPVSWSEREEVVARFSWERMASEFWKAVLA
jgi:hypothetical protein